ncbi:MAG: PAS domain S-box protein, partial [Cyanobacteria bacterium J06635_15]
MADKTMLEPIDSLQNREHRKQDIDIDTFTLEGIQYFSKKVASASDTDQLLTVLQHYFKGLDLVEFCSVALLNPDNSPGYQLFSLAGDTALIPQLMPRDAGWPGQVMAQGQTILLADLTAPAVSLPPQSTVGLVTQGRSLLSLPLSYQGQALGCLTLSHPTPGTYPSAMLEHIRCLVGLTSARLAQLHHFKVELLPPFNHPVLHLFLTLNQAVEESADVFLALSQVIKSVCQFTHWSFGEYWQVEQHGDQPRLVYGSTWYASSPAFDHFGEASQVTTFAPAVGLPGRVWQTQESEWIQDVSQEPKVLFLRADLAMQVGLRSSIGVPIIVQGQVVAVACFFATDPQAIDAQQVQLVSTLITQLESILHLKQTEAALCERERQLSSLMNSLPGIVFAADADPGLTMRYLSHGCYQLTGYTSEELTGPNRRVTYNDVTYPEDLPGVLALMHHAIAQKQPYEVEYRIRTKSGLEKWLWEKGAGVFDETGQLIGLEGFITEITNLKHIEQALRISESRYRLLADNVHDVISRHRIDGTCLYLSPACQTLLGYSPTTLVGRQLLDFIHRRDWVSFHIAYQRLLQARESQTLTYRIRHQAGHYLWFETITKVIDSPGQGNGVEVLAVSRDITERKLAEKMLRQRERFLQLVLDSIPQQIFWKDRDCHYLGGNEAFAKAIGLNHPTEIVGLSDRDIAFYSDAEAESGDRAVMANNQPELGVLQSQRVHDQGWRWLECSKFPIQSEEGETLGVLGTCEDVTDQLNSARSLAKREQYMSALVDVQRQLLALDRDACAEDWLPILAPLGQVAEACRVYIYKLHRNTQPPCFRQVAEWSAQGIPSTTGLAAFQQIPMAPPFEDWLAHLTQGEAINQTQDDFTELQRQLLSAPPANVRSLLLLPLVVKAQLIGTIGFSNCQTPQRWENTEVELLRGASVALSLVYERWQVEESLRQTEAKYRSIFENAVEGIFQSTLDGHYTTVNPMLAQLYGYESPEDLITSLENIGEQLYVAPNRRSVFVALMQAQAGSVLSFESQVYRKDGSIIWVSESARAIYDSHHQIIGYEGTVEDITARKQAEVELYRRDRFLQGVAVASHHLLATADFDTAIERALAVLGEAAEADRVYIYQNHAEPVTGKPMMTMCHEWSRPGVAPSIGQPHWQALPYSKYGLMRWHDIFSAGQSIRSLVRDLPKSERELLAKDQILSLLMVPIFIDGQFWGYIGFDACLRAKIWSRNEESILVAIAASVGSAIKRQQTEAQMRYQAFHDALTGLPNRMLFNQHLPLAIDHAKRTGETLAVMFLDLDRFKTINDTLGHAVGDQLLEQATQRLTQTLREQDIIARWGGDEFTLILPNLPLPGDVVNVAQRLLESLKAPFRLGEQDLYVTSSIGIARYPQDGEDMKTLLQNADAAMYRAKEEGRNKYQFYTTTINSKASERLVLENSLHHALARGQFLLHYQPQINIVTGKIIQVEALIRWHHPEWGVIAPDTFISIAEENGLIVPIGEWVLRSACAQNKRWQNQGI